MPKTDINGLIKKFAKLRNFHFTAQDMRAFADIVKAEREAAFERGEAPDGSKWKELKPETTRRKAGLHTTTKVLRRKGISGLGRSKQRKVSLSPEKPLIDTGALMIPTVEAKQDEARIKMARSRSDSVWDGKGIGQIHNEGAGKIPKREHWAIYPRALELIEDLKEKIFTRFVRSLF